MMRCRVNYVPIPRRKYFIAIPGLAVRLSSVTDNLNGDIIIN